MSGVQPQDALSGAKEHKLALAAAGGDGHAFAQLYETYEQRIYNYCLRLLNDRHEAEDATQEAFLKVLRRLPDMEDREFEFGAYLFTTARNTSYDVIGKKNRTEVTDEIPESGNGHLHKDGADLGSDPTRSAMLESQREQVREANERLPVRQREVLVLREVEGLSYDEIASTMDMKSNAVAQLISRARTNLRGEMRLGAASGITPGSADCEKALPLLAARADGEIKDPADRVWLETHLDGCEMCQLSDEAMAEAGISYRAWAPVIPAAYLFRDTLAKAAEITGSDWSGIERPTPAAGGSADGAAASNRNWNVLAGAAAGVLLLVFMVSAVMASRVDDATLILGEEQVSAPFTKTVVDEPEKEAKKQKKEKKGEGRNGAVPSDEVTEVEIIESVGPGGSGNPGSNSNGGGNGGSGGNGNGGNGNPQVNQPDPKPPVVQPDPDPQPPVVPEPEPEPEPEPPVVPPDPPDPPTPPTPGGPTFPIPG